MSILYHTSYQEDRNIDIPTSQFNKMYLSVCVNIQHLTYEAYQIDQIQTRKRRRGQVKAMALTQPKLTLAQNM